jgi:hypothetical protein
MEMQYSVHWAHQFLQTHLEQLLPDWSVPVLSILVVLQMSQCVLLDKTPETELHKQRLRERFVKFGRMLAGTLCEMGYLAEVFDPQTGLPLLSTPGELKLDDVAVVQACLGYSLTDSGGCSILHHPVWGSAVYPSVLVSSAHPMIIESIAGAVAASSDWAVNFSLGP